MHHLKIHHCNYHVVSRPGRDAPLAHKERGCGCCRQGRVRSHHHQVPAGTMECNQVSQIKRVTTTMIWTEHAVQVMFNHDNLPGFASFVFHLCVYWNHNHCQLPLNPVRKGQESQQVKRKKRLSNAPRKTNPLL